VLSFLMLPPNLVVLAPAAFVAAIATWLAGPEREVWLNTLLRFVAALAIALATIGLVSIMSILGNDDGGPTDFEGIFLRVGGIAMAAGLAMICRIADVTGR
jgi:4-amino-4-deoxy-L-arabinose transferase-like glycosyltransferase